MLRYPGEEHIISSPTIPMMKKTVIPYTKKFYQEFGLQEGRDYKYFKQDMIFEHRRGLGVIYCISALNADRMQGIHAKTITGDEAGLFEKLWIDTANQRISYRGGQILLTTTPYSMNWLYHDVFKPWKDGDPDIELVNPSTFDNPFFPLRGIRKARRKLPGWKFLLMYLAKFTMPAGLIYPQYSIIEPFTIPKDWFKFRGLDFGYNNPSGIVHVAQSPKTGKFYVFDEFKQSGLDYKGLFHRLTLGDSPIYADPSEKQGLKYLQNKGLPIRSANNAVMPGIMALSGMIRTDDIIFFSTLVHLIDELNTYQWNRDKKENYLEQPRKINDHLLDALRYAIFTLCRKGVPRVSYVSEGGKIDQAVEKLLRDTGESDLDNILGRNDPF